MATNFRILFDEHTDINFLAKDFSCHPDLFILNKAHLQLHRIPKKKFGYRLVWQITDKATKRLIEVFTLEFEAFIKSKIKYPLPCIQGFLPKRSAYTNASLHVNNHYLLNLDIENFFDSITTEQIESLFIRTGIRKEIARILANFLTVNGSLPQGFESSPLLSNLIFFPLDEKLYSLASHYQSTYSRYADDITFSSKQNLPPLQEINNILNSNGFKVNKKKTIYRKRGQAFYVTGLSISEDRPRIPKKWKKKLRQDIYYIIKFGIINHCEKNNIRTNRVQRVINNISGKLGYLKKIEPKIYQTTYPKWIGYLKSINKKVTYLRNEKLYKPIEYSYYIDEMQHEGFLFLCLCKVKNKERIELKIENLHTAVSQNSYMPRIYGTYKNKFFHWKDMSLTARRDLAEFLATIEFDAYISCKKINKAFQKTYLRLYKNLLEKRFIKCDNSIVDIYVENHDELSINILQPVTDLLYENAVNLNSKRPLENPKVKILSKTCSFNLCLPDSILGIIKQHLFLKPHTNKNELPVLESIYFRLRHKIRTFQFISKDNQQKVFTVRNPIDPVRFLDLISS